MNYLFPLLLTAVFTFVATNLDDILILMVFFSPKLKNIPISSIILGKYLGLTVIILASLPGFFGGLLIPKAWIGLLGIIPLVIGIKSLVSGKDEVMEAQVVNFSDQTDASSQLFKKIPHRWLNGTILYVTSITIANGGDNISVYLSLFAQETPLRLTILITIFYSLLGLWCWLAYWLVRHPLIAKLFLKYGGIITPCILILLGIFIIIDSGTFGLIFSIS